MDSFSQWFSVSEVFGSRLQLVLLTTVLTPVIYGIFVFAKIYREAAAIAKHVDKLPGRPTHVLWGNLHEFPDIYEGMLKTFRENMETHGFRRIYRTWFGPLNPVVTVNHPDTMKIMLKHSQPKYLPENSNAGYALLLPWLGEGVLISDGQRWSRSRRLLTPAFHFDILKGYIAVYNTACRQFVINLTKAASEGQYVEIFDKVSMCTLDVILKCAFSYEENVQESGIDCRSRSMVRIPKFTRHDAAYLVADLRHNKIQRVSDQANWVDVVDLRDNPINCQELKEIPDSVTVLSDCPPDTEPTTAHPLGPSGHHHDDGHHDDGHHDGSHHDRDMIMLLVTIGLSLSGLSLLIVIPMGGIVIRMYVRIRAAPRAREHIRLIRPGQGANDESDESDHEVVFNAPMQLRSGNRLRRQHRD